ncbi:MAG: hypothetical protein JHD16_05415 [Solirubrobacteraceae bacterium]|nr:hypothetical protein [Solirubrobacteraceae bacterium]
MALRRKPAQVKAWLQSDPPLGELRAAYPDQWEIVERELMAVVNTGDPAALTAYARALAEPQRVRPGAKRSITGLDPVLAAMVRQRMGAHAIRTLSTRAATGVASGTVRFGDEEGTIIQRLLFHQGLDRKPVSLADFNAVWPSLKERARLMPLVQPQGIYCFYSAEFVHALIDLIDGRRCLEIAAGDGTLARFLNDAGGSVRATDDHSWKAVSFPADVEQLDAVAALRAHQPQVVLCSWPPAGNTFESSVFSTSSVQTYVVVGNRYTPGWGNHDTYAKQTAFGLRSEERLAAMVLPPELEPVVYVFERDA